MNNNKFFMAALGAASIQSIAFKSSATSGAATITAPSDIVAGDLIVLYDRATNTSGTVTAVTPSGFTSILNQLPQTILRFICSFKIADGTEAGATITGMNGTSFNQKILLVFSTNGATTGSAFDVAFENTDGDPISQTVNAFSGSSPLLVISIMRQLTATGQSFSPAQEGTVNNGSATAYYKIYNSSPADVTVDCGDGGNANALMSFYIEVN